MHLTLQTTAIKYCINLNKSLYCITTTLIGAGRLFSLFKHSVIMKESDRKRPLAVSDITLFDRFTVLHAMRLFTSFRPAFENVDAFSLQNFASIKHCALAN